MNSDNYVPLTTVQSKIDVTHAILSCKQIEQEITVNDTEYFNLTFSIVDKNSLYPLNNINWKVKDSKCAFKYFILDFFFK